MPGQNLSTEKAEPNWFQTTRWSVVQRAGADSSESDTALEQLCRAYWYPIYVYVRRKGHDAEQAKDLTQEFFSQLLAKNIFAAADRSKGKFRSFLLGTLDHFLAREWTKANRQKRGGGCRVLSLDEQDPEHRYRIEPLDHFAPDKAFERQWALSLLELAMQKLRDEYSSPEKAVFFQKLRGTVSGDRPDVPYAEMGRVLGMSEGAVKVAAHRMRQRYGELLRAELAQTVSSPAELEDELRFLSAAIRD